MQKPILEGEAFFSLSGGERVAWIPLHHTWKATLSLQRSL